jgi:hypothetical protein
LGAGGTINTEIEIPVYVNMEAFNGFQFDVAYNITYVNNSIIESLRLMGTALVLLL